MPSDLSKYWLLGAAIFLVATFGYSHTDTYVTKPYAYKPAKSVRIWYEALENDSSFRHGKYKLYYNGDLQVTGYFYENQRQGEWKKFYSNGDLHLHGSYLSGKKHGDWKYYHRNGKVGATMSYVNGLKVGSWAGFFSDGTPACLYNFKNDIIQGEFVLYHPNGLIAQNTKVVYEDTNLIVHDSRYYSNGKLYEEVHYYNELLDSNYRRYHDNGLIWEDFVYERGKLKTVHPMKSRRGVKLQQGEFRNGNGEVRYYNADGTLHSILNYRHGERSGRAQFYYKKKLASEGNFHSNKPIGTWMYYSEYSKLRMERNFYNGEDRIYERSYTGSGAEGQEGEKVNGLKEGIWRTYNFLGDKLEELHYHLGFEHGLAKRFESNSLREKGGYYFGEKVGAWKYYNMGGKVSFEENFLKEISFDSTLIEPQETATPRVQMHNFNYETQVKEAYFPGGRKAETAFIQDNLVRSEQVKELQITGKILAHITIDEIGSVKEVKILRGIGYGCDREVIRVFKSMPNWSPSTTNGIPGESSVIRVIEI